MDTTDPASQPPADGQETASNGNGTEKMDAQPTVQEPAEKKEKKPKKLIFELPIAKTAGYSIPLDAFIAFEVSL